MRRTPTIGVLGRGAARKSQPPEDPPPSGPPPERGVVARLVHGALFENTALKFLSMVLAVTVFLLINNDKDRDITVRVPVRYEYPSDKVLTSPQQDEVHVTIKGPWRRLRQFDERELGRVTLDLHSATNADVAITPDMIANLPPGLAITSISPRSVRVEFDARVEKLVEVSPLVAGRPERGYVVAEIKASPPTIKVRGGARLLASISKLRTNEISLQNHTDSFEQLAEILPPVGVEIDPTQRITIQVRVVEELVTRTLSNQRVTVRGDGIDPTRWSIVPPRVEVTLTGPLLAVERVEDAPDTVVPIVTPANDRRPQDLEVAIEGIPPGMGSKVSPPRVKLTPAKPNAPP